MKTYNVVLAELNVNNDSLANGICLLDTVIYRSEQPKHMSELLCKKDRDSYIYDLGIGAALITIVIFLCFLWYKIGKSSK